MHSCGMTDFRDLLSRWTIAELAADLTLNLNTAAAMKQRASVAPSHWALLIEAARRKGLTIDEAMLARFWRESKAQKRQRREAA